MRLLIECRRREDEIGACAASGLPRSAFRPASATCRLKPVYVGDTVAYSTEVIDAAAGEPPGMGVVSWRNWRRTPAGGEPVISFISSAFVERESKAGAP